MQQLASCVHKDGFHLDRKLLLGVSGFTTGGMVGFTRGVALPVGRSDCTAGGGGASPVGGAGEGLILRGRSAPARGAAVAVVAVVSAGAAVVVVVAVVVAVVPLPDLLRDTFAGDIDLIIAMISFFSYCIFFW